MTKDEERLLWLWLPVALVIGIALGLLPGDHIWVPVN